MTPKTAIQVAAVFRCVDLLSKTMASLPLHLYEETDTGKEKAKNHPVYNLVYALPNVHTTAYEFWQMFVANLLLTKGRFAKIVRDRRGTIKELYNIPTATWTGFIQTLSAVSGTLMSGMATKPNACMSTAVNSCTRRTSFLFTDIDNSENPPHIAADVLGLTRNP